MVKEEWEEGGWEGVGVGLGGGAAIVCGQCSFVNCTNKRLLVGMVNGLNWAGQKAQMALDVQHRH